jgi:hypothetical protein
LVVLGNTGGSKTDGKKNVDVTQVSRDEFNRWLLVS